MKASHSDDRIRILHVIHSMDVRKGGVSQGIRNMVPVLGTMGSVNEVACFDDLSTFSLLQDDFTIRKLGATANPWGYKRGFLRWLKPRLSDYDAIIVHGLWLYHSMATVRAVKAFRRDTGGKSPLVLVMPHGMLDPWFQTHPSRRVKAWRNRLYWRLFERRTIRDADAVLFTSPVEIARAAGTFPGYAPAMEVDMGFGSLEPPAPTDAMRIRLMERCPALAHEPFILYLGRIDRKKGIGMLLDAYEAVGGHSIVPIRLPRLLIAGPGWHTPDGRAVRDRVIGNDFLLEHVDMSDMLQGDLKWGALHACEALALPSHQENFGVVVAEALSCGKPVLISDKVNIHAAVTAAGAGIVRPDTPEGMAEMLSEWIALTEGQRSDMGTRARRAYADHFRMESACLRLMELLQRLG